MAGIVKPNNSFLDIPYIFGRTAKNRYHMFLYDCDPITKEDLESMRVGKHDITEKDLLDLFKAKNATLLGRLTTENMHDCRINPRYEWSARIAQDPVELTVIKEGTPKFALIIGNLNSEVDIDNPRDNEPVESVMVCTVGDIGSGADIELLNGTVDFTSTYKFNNFSVNLPE